MPVQSFAERGWTLPKTLWKSANIAALICCFRRFKALKNPSWTPPGHLLS